MKIIRASKQGTFSLVTETSATSFLIETADAKVVRIVAKLLLYPENKMTPD